MSTDKHKEAPGSSFAPFFEAAERTEAYWDEYLSLCKTKSERRSLALRIAGIVAELQDTKTAENRLRFVLKDVFSCFDKDAETITAERVEAWRADASPNNKIIL
jgi:hypothetical protein